MTDFSLPDDAVALRDGLRELLATACTPATIRAAWEGDACDGLWKELGGFGLLGLLAPEPEGLGLDELSLVAALDECGYVGVPGPLVETVVVAGSGGLPTDGSVRVAVQRGDLLPYAGWATHVLAGTDLVPAADTAFGPAESVDRSRRTGRVPASGAEVSELVQLRATLGTAAFLCGLGRRQVELTVDYLKGRKQFGVPIGSFQGLKHPLAAAVVDLEFAWPVVLHAAYALANEDPHARRHVSHAKAAASDAAYRVSRVCLQAHGAIGYTVEYDLHLFMKRTWALAKDWGTSEEHRALIAEEIL